MPGIPYPVVPDDILETIDVDIDGIVRTVSQIVSLDHIVAGAPSEIDQIVRPRVSYDGVVEYLVVSCRPFEPEACPAERFFHMAILDDVVRRASAGGYVHVDPEPADVEELQTIDPYVVSVPEVGTVGDIGDHDLLVVVSGIGNVVALRTRAIGPDGLPVRSFQNIHSISGLYLGIGLAQGAPGCRHGLSGVSVISVLSIHVIYRGPRIHHAAQAYAYRQAKRANTVLCVENHCQSAPKKSASIRNG